MPHLMAHRGILGCVCHRPMWAGVAREQVSGDTNTSEKPCVTCGPLYSTGACEICTLGAFCLSR